MVNGMYVRFLFRYTYSMFIHIENYDDNIPVTFISTTSINSTSIYIPIKYIFSNRFQLINN